MKKILSLLLSLPILSAFASAPLFALTPVGTLPTTLYAQTSTTAYYTVTNESIYALTQLGLGPQNPSGVRQLTGAGLCPLKFTLGPAGSSTQSCRLGLTITAGAVGWVANSGPEVCSTQSHPVHCAVPSPGSELNITAVPYSSPLFTLSTPTNVNGINMYYGSQKSVTYTVRNVSPYALSGNTITLPTLASGTGGSVSLSANTCASVAANSTCSFTMLITAGGSGWTAMGGPTICTTNPPSGTQPSNTCTTASGSSLVNITSSAFPGASLTLTANSSPTIGIYTYTSTTISYTVKNDTPSTLTNFYTTQTGITINDPTPCNNLAPNATCVLSLTVSPGGGVINTGPQICGETLPPDPYSYCATPNSPNTLNVTTSLFPSPYFTLSVSSGSATGNLYFGETGSVSYLVTNITPYTVNNIALSYTSQMSLDPTPVGVTWDASSTCASTFSLAPSASCTLTLDLTADDFVDSLANGGPLICGATDASHGSYTYCGNPASDILDYTVTAFIALAVGEDITDSYPYFAQSLNSGTTWSSGLVPSGLSPSNAFTSSACSGTVSGSNVDGAFCVMSGAGTHLGTTPSVIYSTTNAETWVNANLSLFYSVIAGSACTPTFGTCLVAGSNSNVPVVYQYTSSTPAWTLVPTLQSNGAISAASCGAGLCAVVGANGTAPFAYQTTDLTTWSSIGVSLPATAPTDPVLISCDLNLCVGMGYGTSNGSAFVFVTQNSGSSWTVSSSIATLDQFVPYSVSCNAIASICVAVGKNLGSNTFEVVYTADFNTWTPTTIGAMAPFTGPPYPTASCSSVFCAIAGNVSQSVPVPLFLSFASAPIAFNPVAVTGMTASTNLHTVACAGSYCFAAGVDVSGLSGVVAQGGGLGSWSVVTIPGLPTQSAFYGSSLYPSTDLFRNELKYFKTKGINQYQY